jgi:hypothetical protein
MNMEPSFYLKGGETMAFVHAEFFHVEQLVGLIIKKKEMKQSFWHRRECFKW